MRLGFLRLEDLEKRKTLYGIPHSSATMAVIGENSPLLGTKGKDEIVRMRSSGVTLVYICVFLISLSVTFTWVP